MSGPNYCKELAIICSHKLDNEETLRQKLISQLKGNEAGGFSSHLWMIDLIVDDGRHKHKVTGKYFTRGVDEQVRIREE